MRSLFNLREKVSAKVVMLSTNELVPNKSQPRITFNNDEIYSLSESIRENGILQPICVRKSGAVYEIISGERRSRAAKMAGLQEVPCIIMDVDDEQSAIYALIENIQRKDLSFFEEALAIEKLISFYGLTQEEAAERLGKAQSTIANKLRLLRFTDSERNLLLTGGLSERQARAIIRIDDEKARYCVIEKVIKNGLNLQQTEELVCFTLDKPERAEKKKSSSIKLNAPPRVYMNSLNALIKRIKDDKIPCDLSTDKTDKYYEYVLRFPINI